MGGVINMVTKSNFSNKTFRYDAGIGSFNNSILNLNYSQKINNINLFTSAGYNNSNGHRFNANHNTIRGPIILFITSF